MQLHQESEDLVKSGQDGDILIVVLQVKSWIRHIYVDTKEANTTTTSPYSTVTKIVPLKCMWLARPWELSSLLTLKLKSQAVCTFWFICKHIVVEMHYFYELWVYIKSDLQTHSRSLAIMEFDMLYTWFPISLPLSYVVFDNCVLQFWAGFEIWVLVRFKFISDIV